ncbi:STAS domain-containing protein [Desulfobacterales bacterium HSG2]|nr:STAS domain-containing protein [Desulfobacterales bacterium HSG2]
MEITVSKKKESVHFAFSDGIDELGAEILNKRFRELEKRSLRKLVLDFKKVDYIGSSGIGQLILFYQLMAASGGRIRIENASKDIYDILMDLDIDKLMSISRT